MRHVSDKALRLLRRIHESDDQELVHEAHGGWWIGFDQTRPGSAFHECVRLCLLGADLDALSAGRGRLERWTLTGCGEAVLKNPEHEPLILKTMSDRERNPKPPPAARKE